MKTIASLIAAGSLAALTTPATAAEHGAPLLELPQTEALELEVVPNSLAATLAYGDPPRHARAYGRRYKDRDWDDDDWDDDDDYRERRRYRGKYDRSGRYYQPRRLHRGDRIWRGRDGRYYCRRDNGTTGLVIGAGVGALAGRAIDTRGDRTLGTVLGAIAGGLIGREIDRGEIRCR